MGKSWPESAQATDWPDYFKIESALIPQMREYPWFILRKKQGNPLWNEYAWSLQQVHSSTLSAGCLIINLCSSLFSMTRLIQLKTADGTRASISRQLDKSHFQDSCA